MKRKLFIVLLLCICVGLFFSCAKKETTETVRIRFCSWRTEDVAVYAELIDMFQKQNPGITVVYEPYRTEEYQTVLATNFSGGTAADVVHLRAYGNFEQFARPGYLMPLTEADIPELKLFSAQSLKGSTSIADNKVYGIPYASQSLVIYYNQEVYNKLGLKIPETWAEFISNLEACRNANVIPIANGTFAGWAAEVMWGVFGHNFYGGNSFYDGITAGTTNFQDPRFIRSLDAFQSLLKFMPSGFVALDYVDSQMMFINDLAAHFFGGIWEAAYFSSQNPSLKFDCFVSPPLNKGDPKHLSFYMDGSYGIFNNSTRKAEAIKFVRFLASKEVQQILSDRLGVKTEHPEVRFTNPFIQKVSAPDLVQTPYVFLVGFRYEQPTGSALMQAALQAIAGGQQNSQQAAADIQQGISIYYAPFKK